jgi:hypothetical protein
MRMTRTPIRILLRYLCYLLFKLSAFLWLLLNLSVTFAIFCSN